MPHAAWFAGLTGILAGFTTMIANAAGPVMGLYLLAMNLPKLGFLGTMVWFFFFVNLFKVPFSWCLNLINSSSLAMDGILVVALLPGVLLGPRIVKHIPQRAFEWMVLVLTIIAAIRLVIRGIPGLMCVAPT